MAARLDSPPRVEEAADLDAEEEELLRLTQERTLAALGRYVTERLHGRTAESTARYRAAVRGAAGQQGRQAAPRILRACSKREEEEVAARRRVERVVGEGGGSVLRIKEDEAAARANAARIGDKEDGREASSFTGISNSNLGDAS